MEKTKCITCKIPLPVPFPSDQTCTSCKEEFRTWKPGKEKVTREIAITHFREFIICEIDRFWDIMTYQIVRPSIRRIYTDRFSQQWCDDIENYDDLDKNLKTDYDDLEEDLEIIELFDRFRARKNLFYFDKYSDFLIDEINVFYELIDESTTKEEVKKIYLFKIPILLSLNINLLFKNVPHSIDIEKAELTDDLFSLYESYIKNRPKPISRGTVTILQ